MVMRLDHGQVMVADTAAAGAQVNKLKNICWSVHKGQDSFFLCHFHDVFCQLSNPLP